MSQSMQPIDLASGWSHDIRTHLNIIKGAVVMMESGKLTQEQTKEYTEMIRHNVQSMERLVNHLLNPVAQNKVMVSKPVYMQIDGLLCRVLESVTPFAASKQVHLLCDISRPLHAYCDPEMLERVLYNLLANAVKCTDANGAVYLSGCSQKGSIQINVADTGCGMSDVQLAQQLGSVDQSAGNGYGLRLVKMMMAAMKGSIACQSQQNVGTTFYLRLPDADISHHAVQNADMCSTPVAYTTVGGGKR